MELFEGAVSAPFFVKAKGRVVLPATARRAAHLDEGAEIVARVVGEGQLLLETRDAVRARVRAAAPSPTGLDAVADVRQMRNEDISRVRRNAEKQLEAMGDEADSAAAGAALLKHLGL